MAFKNGSGYPNIRFLEHGQKWEPKTHLKQGTHVATPTVRCRLVRAHFFLVFEFPFFAPPNEKKWEPKKKIKTGTESQPKVGTKTSSHFCMRFGTKNDIHPVPNMQLESVPKKYHERVHFSELLTCPPCIPIVEMLAPAYARKHARPTPAVSKKNPRAVYTRLKHPT